MADTWLHHRRDAQANPFDRQPEVRNTVVREGDAVTDIRRMSQGAVTLAGVIEGGPVGGKYGSHGPVLPIRMRERAHRRMR